MEEIVNRLTQLEKTVQQQTLMIKSVLVLPDAAQYLGLSCSYLYKLTSTGKIPCYKPNGKKLYFHREELDRWLLRNRRITQEELDQQAADYCIQRKRSLLR